MPRPRIDPRQRITEILKHTDSLTEEAKRPLEHYKRSADDLWNLRNYVDRKIADSKHYQSVATRHMTSLDRMLLVNLVEVFERFLKETAAVCVDHVADYVLDDRFDEFPVSGSILAAHFAAGSLGRSLCESATWLNCKAINDRFRKLLSDPFDPQKGKFYLFPHETSGRTGGQLPEDERFRHPIVSLLWQLRNTIVHNVRVITESDAVNLRPLARGPVDSLRMLAPQRDDVRYVKQFLDDTAEMVNNRVGERLAELLTTLHQDDNTLFEPTDKANELVEQFQIPMTVARERRTP